MASAADPTAAAGRYQSLTTARATTTVPATTLPSLPPELSTMMIPLPLPSSSLISLPFHSNLSSESSTYTKEILLIVAMTAIYYVGVGITVMPRVMLINQRIAGNSRHPNSESAFVDSTAVMLNTLATVLFSKYFSSLGDYIGRRPVLGISIIFSIASNLLWLGSTSPLGFYLASIVRGVGDIFFYVGISWLCDIASDKTDRGKAIGLYVGTVAGLTLSIAIPVGAGFSSKNLLAAAFKLAIILYCVVLLMLIFIPLNDTLGIIPKYGLISNLDTGTPSPISNPNLTSALPLIPPFNQRHFPPDCYMFFLEHLPISWDTIKLLCKETSRPLDWVGNLLMHTAFKALRLIIMQYFFVVCDFPPLIVGACSILLGVISFFTLPFFLSRYTPETLLGLTALGSSVGFLLLSAAGTYVNYRAARILSLFGLSFLAFSASWHPSFQTILTSQYPMNIMGSVSGTLAIATEFGYFPAYGIAVLFSLSLSHQQESRHIWPGCSFLICVVLCWIAIALHVWTRGWKFLKLTRINLIHPDITVERVKSGSLNSRSGLMNEEIQEVAPVSPVRVLTELRSYPVDSNSLLALEEIP